MQVCNQDFGLMSDKKVKRKLNDNAPYSQNSQIIEMEIPKALVTSTLVNLTFAMN